MTLNRLVTTLVQLALLIPTVYLMRLVIAEIKQDVKEWRDNA
jgi:hypothetical protein